MKTKWIPLHLCVLTLFSSSCIKTIQTAEPFQVYSSNFESFARGEKGIYETFQPSAYPNKAIVKGTIIDYELVFSTSRYTPKRFLGIKITLDNGKKFEIFNEDSNSIIGEDMLRNMLSEGRKVHIEATIPEESKRKSCKYAFYDKGAYDYGSTFYKSGKKKKNLAPCSLDVKTYSYNRFYGSIKNAAKSRVYERIFVYFGTKSIELVYLDNGDVLCSTLR